jgi:hypothetical protein
MRSANPLTHPDSPPPVARVSSPPSLELSGIDFGNQQDWVRIKIYPTSQQVNDGQPVILKFIPGQRCIFGDNHACVAAFIDNEGTPVIWLTIHSGVGGEGQPFRDAVEGTGIDRAAYSLKKILSNLQALSGSQVVISQGTRTIRPALASDGAHSRIDAARLFQHPLRKYPGFLHPDRSRITFG